MEEDDDDDNANDADDSGTFKHTVRKKNMDIFLLLHKHATRAQHK